MTVRERIIDVIGDLPPAERRVAEVVVDDPKEVAFGTVAAVAARAGASGPSVVRLSRRIGYAGFVELQDAIRAELGERLRPAVERIRERPVHDAVGRTLETSLANVQATLDAIEPDAFRIAADLLAARSRAVAVLSGEATFGIAHAFASDLGLVRAGVDLVAGSEVRVDRTLALLEPDDVVVVMDLRRYERWVVEAARAAADAGARLVAVTDSAISPLAERADAVFTVEASSPGPFDSHVGTLALTNALVAAVAGRLRRFATARLDRIERRWSSSGALVERF
ncbi:MAG: MurR/RpiR family transcriptional regulator [Acidimicrobiia bacterium]|nr:MurR/RpiR family transcriptional regulator [Acidimicrobiia bacterium]